ncbi:MAG TPA: TIGR03790 family protein [Bryobacteraceae bacterium]|nr:TIGR03790 family protein [Bryobacteraceae bacterium]
MGQYYASKRSIPTANICPIDTPPDNDISRAVYESAIETPIGRCLTRHKLTESILYIVLTQGVPLRIGGEGQQFQNTQASVDSELTLLYQKLHGANIPLAGPIPNPFFGHRDSPFRHPQFPIYLVTRLAGYNMIDLKRLVDLAPQARNTGKFVIDLRADNATSGNQWLRAAALLLPKDRVILDDTAKILSNISNVIGYASWGSNDSDRHERFLHFQWLPGAVATEYVSTDGRTFNRPPDQWKLGKWGDPQSTWFFGAPQTMTGDYIHEGASGASGQIDEPYLPYCPRPDFVLPAYFQGRNLAESFYMGILGLSWKNVVVGDPLMHLQ